MTHFNDNPNVTEYTKGNENWAFHHGNSNLIFDEIHHFQYDLILHDGSHVSSEVYIDLENAYPYLKHDGILLIHDTRHEELGEGMVSAFNKFIKNKELEVCELPYGYGLTIIRNKSNIKNKIELTWKKRK